MQEQYRREIDNIHAPKDLIERTRKQMEAEVKQTKKKPKKPIWIGTAVAACICITVLGGYFYIGKIRTNIDIQNVSFEETSDWETGFSLGGRQDGESGKTTKIEWEELEGKEDIPEAVLKVKPSKIHGKSIYICKEKGTDNYYAAYEKGDNYFYIYGKNITEKEFLTFLEKIL